MKSLIKSFLILAIIIATLIGGEAICFAGEKDSADKCANIPELPNGAVKLVTKIIDGDTILIEGGHSLRLLGIDADERDHPCYEPAKSRLEELILNKEIQLEKGTGDKDQWCRYLRYVLLDNQNIGLKLVKEGLVVARLSPEDVKYQKEITQAEKEARGKKAGCKWGKPEEKKKEYSWKLLTPKKTGLSVIGACQAGEYAGKEIIVEGLVAGTFRSKTDTVFLNFEKSYPKACFTAVIFSSGQALFIDAPEKYYSFKTVRIKGKIKKYQGKPEIVLEDPAQIEIGK